jgi:hypothetical protein
MARISIFAFNRSFCAKNFDSRLRQAAITIVGASHPYPVEKLRSYSATCRAHFT